MRSNSSLSVSNTLITANDTQPCTVIDTDTECIDAATDAAQDSNNNYDLALLTHFTVL